MTAAPYTLEITQGETVILTFKDNSTVQGLFVTETDTAIRIHVWDAQVHEMMLVQYFKNQDDIRSLKKAANHHV